MPTDNGVPGETASPGRLVRCASRILSRPHIGLVPPLLAVLLTLPSLRVGLVGDDLYHRVALGGSGRFFSPFVHGHGDMFRFFDGDAGRTRQQMDVGFIPWWTYPEIRGAFWRPMTVLTHQLDYLLWPDSPALMHLQSVLWYGVLAAAAGWLYRRLIPVAWVAALAALLYAIDDAHGMPVGFLANRNSPICTLLGVLTLYAHDVWRRNGSRRAACAGPLLLLLALLAKEEGVAVCAYLAAYTLFLDRGTFWRRAATLVPYAAVVLGWRVTWSQLGYGVAHIGLYVDPLHEPWLFARGVVERVPYLLLGQWALPPAETYLLGNLIGPAVVRGLWWVGTSLMLLLAVLFAPLLRREPVARFWALGMLLSLVPMCATAPADRMLFFPGLGAMGLLALWLGSIRLPHAAGLSVRRKRGLAPSQSSLPPPKAHPSEVPVPSCGGLMVQRLQRVGVATAVAGLLLVHVLIAPLALPVRAAYPVGPPIVDQFYLRAPLDEHVEQQTVVLVNPPIFMCVVFAMADREARGLPVPHGIRFLASGWQPVELRRLDDRTLIVHPADGFITELFERLFRDERNPMRVGQRVDLSGVTVEVTQIADHWRPAEAAFRFAVPLEDDSLRWLAWSDGQFQPFTPPSIGETIEVSYSASAR